MELHKFTNKRGYFFDGSTLLIGIISGGESAYCKQLSGKVIYSKPFEGSCFTRPWRVGYSYDNWDFRDFEYIPAYAFSKGLRGYLNFLEQASYEEIKAYFAIKELSKTED